MSAPAGPTPSDGQVVWVMATEAADDLKMLLGILEDFLRQANLEVVVELADYPSARPADPSVWADWVADRLGDAALDLHTLTKNRTGEQR